MLGKKSWTNQEDSALRQIVLCFASILQKDDSKWNQVSHVLKQQLTVYKTPNQCRDRWNNHLQTGTPKEFEWTYEEQIQLFQLQEKLGNKWTVIAQQLSKRKEKDGQTIKKSDSTVKNCFYATLRRSIRMINNFISQNRQEQNYKNMKFFAETCVGKIVAQDQKKKIDKMRVTKDNISLEAKCKLKFYKDIKTLLWNIAKESGCKELMEEAIQKLLEFNRSCRRLRCKKRKTGSAQDEDDFVDKKPLSIKNTNQEDFMLSNEQKKMKMRDYNNQEIKIQHRIVSGSQADFVRTKQGYLSSLPFKKSEAFQEFSLADPFKKIDYLKLECEGGIQRICKCPQIFIPSHQLQINQNLNYENQQPQILLQEYISL